MVGGSWVKEGRLGSAQTRQGHSPWNLFFEGSGQGEGGPTRRVDGHDAEPPPLPHQTPKRLRSRGSAPGGFGQSPTFLSSLDHPAP
jgi:hypothetical protein